MNKKTRRLVILMAAAVLAVWAYCDFKRDPSPLYIPGRDTLKHWNDGVCEIIGEAGQNSLYVSGRQVTAYDDFVAAWKQVDDELFFITEKGKAVVNLEDATYVFYDGDPADAAHADMFSDDAAFEWLTKFA